MQKNIFNFVKNRMQDGEPAGRPLVTISYAQTLDGSISIRPTSQLKLSNSKSLFLTHQLRSIHDAILIGIGTLIADDPLLTVRLVDGKNPQPVVVDSRLRFPLKARLLTRNAHKPWIATTELADQAKNKCIREAGCMLFSVPHLKNNWVSLPLLMKKLYSLGIRSIMVEGGARIISSFLENRLADQLVVSVTPMLLGGYRGVQSLSVLPQKYLKEVRYQTVEDNLIVWGELKRDES